ncbi:hypothetical protein LUZ62_049490 [Rhynchospora pubera]|uniref:Glycosyltransferase 61 catalytic domain-containing protein n=1 Tax=Rhynchospora pubera TaxID=906938 RepID=A0AAV8FXP6_9POAL|nr:hypothetical protein LUZ62_049490 [Rhynchospora pubera]
MNLSKSSSQVGGRIVGLFFLVVGFFIFLTLFPYIDRQSIVITKSEKLKAMPLIVDTRKSEKSGIKAEKVLQPLSKPKTEPKSICDFSAYRTDICVMKGDIRIHGNSSLVLFAPNNPNEVAASDLNKTWVVKPYARKNDGTMATIRNVTLKSFARLEKAPRCTTNHSVAAVIFSDWGYCGNYWHDFNDVLVPLFITTRKFNGEVQFLVTQKRDWFFSKYQPIISGLSKYEVIDFDKEQQVHCYPKAILSLYQHKDFSIDPAKPPYGLSMVSFTKFIREKYSLEKDFAVQIGENSWRKPRLLIIGRKHTRVLTNIDKVISMAEELGFEVVVDDLNRGPYVQEAARVVNPCDVMMGVHGAGLTNIVFLPMNAVVIQIVPLGKLNQLFYDEFGVPSRDMNLKYLQYEILEEESTLIDLYPRDDPIFTDPMSIHKRGWLELSRVYLQQQNVKLDLVRFRPVLEKAMNFLRQ